MNKIQIIFLSFIFLSCGMNDNLPKKIAEDILSSNIKSMDSVFESNRPITSYYIDNVIKRKPSIFFRSSNNFFNKDYFLYLEGSCPTTTPEYVYHYKCETEEKIVQFKFAKVKGIWILKEMILYDPVDKI